MNEEQKLRLLDNSERLERTGRQLTTGYRIILETEEIGSQVLQDLHTQRETIQKSRSRVRVLFF
jgi:vesicle transport through interaction with t-SNAREs protein 1